MVGRAPLPLVPSLTRLGALVAIAAVTLWWMHNRRRNGARLARRPATAQSAAHGSLVQVRTEAPGQHARNGNPRAAGVTAQA
ncbi:hypothetical protein [Pyxidicoccus sp. MSG2]|uniref:hypothetical protein n=1 Tax=Pyxidicoccus sp. MSG2 TaxID=2996790 RepID=UPI002270FDB4|nr:hypothetical protein [Pyxidicoccus sp. MSG2]MCY1014658.1 hypothetical protein [Pyxidicoccus sp. MSG2]